MKILRNVQVETTLVVWNFTGQDRYKSVQPYYMSGVSGILLLFDLTRSETFEKLPEWIDFIHRHDSGKDIPIFLIGTKADLFHLKEVTDAEIGDFVNSHELQGYYEVSFKTGLNVEIVIEKMSGLIYHHRVKKQRLPTGFKLKRKHPDRPMIVDEVRVRSDFVITARTIIDMSYKDILQRIKTLEPHLEAIQKDPDSEKTEWVREELETITRDFKAQDKGIVTLLENSPVSLPTFLSIDLTREWKRSKEKLLYQMNVFKDVFDFVAMLK